MSGKLVQVSTGQNPVWDVAGNGSQGYVAPIYSIPLGSGRVVLKDGRPVWDIAGDGSQGYIDVVAKVN